MARGSAGRDGVDRRAVRRRDVDAEVEVGADLVADEVDARVVEVAAHRMRAVEGLERPRVSRDAPRSHVTAGGGRKGERGEGGEQEEGATQGAP
jgi:hypothetical protein